MTVASLLQEALQSKTLTQHQVALASFILAHQEDTAFFSITQLAAAVDSSEATVVRFCQQLGFKGFPDLKQKLQEEVKRQVQSSSTKVHTVLSYASADSAAAELLEQQGEYLRKSIAQNSPSHIVRAATAIVAAETIYLFGEGTGQVPASAMEFWLTRFGFSVRVPTQKGRRLFDEWIRFCQQDCMVAFIFGRVTKETSTLLDYARQVGAPIIVVTDMADITWTEGFLTLRLERGPAHRFRSTAPAVAIADAVSAAAIALAGDRALDAAEHLEELRQQFELD